MLPGKKYFFVLMLPMLALLAVFACKAKKEETAGTAGVKAQQENWDPPANITEGLGYMNKAPELSFKDPADSVIHLSSLRGYYVLLDFWASWCGPCRYENPNVVKAYKEYRDKKFIDGKGFKVFNVSLDMNRQQWMAAIKKDSLNWPYHVSDLKGWNSEPAAKYGVNSIPANWLISPRGVILASGLRGSSLEKTLSKYIDASSIPDPPAKEIKNKKKNK